MGYRAKTVAELVGVPKSTLLAWERRYGLVSPERADNRYREYTDADVARLRAVKALIDQGLKVSEAIASAEAPAAGPQEALYAALVAMDRPTADAVMERLFAWSFTELIHRLFFPTLRQVGEAWATGDITVAQEHFASAYVQQQMGAMLLRLGGGPAGGSVALLSTLPGEQHSLGALGLAVELALRGWRVHYLGADTPLDALTAAIGAAGPRLVAIGVQRSVPTVELRRFAEAVRLACPAGCRVLIGGAGVPVPWPSVAGVEWARDYSSVLG